jgi:large subunit ribosomal protein L29
VRADDLREKADIELKEMLEDLRKDLFQRSFRSGQDEVEERGKFKKLRRDMAQILTLLRERELGIRDQKPVTGGREK